MHQFSLKNGKEVSALGLLNSIAKQIFGNLQIEFTGLDSIRGMNSMWIRIRKVPRATLSGSTSPSGGFDKINIELSPQLHFSTNNGFFF